MTEEQIIGFLQDAEAGLKVAELCRKHGISEATYYDRYYLQFAQQVEPACT